VCVVRFVPGRGVASPLGNPTNRVVVSDLAAADAAALDGTTHNVSHRGTNAEDRPEHDAHGDAKKYAGANQRLECVFVLDCVVLEPFPSCRRRPLWRPMTIDGVLLPDADPLRCSSSSRMSGIVVVVGREL